jgi:hypothetical protein
MVMLVSPKMQICYTWLGSIFSILLIRIVTTTIMVVVVVRTMIEVVTTMVASVMW